MLAKLIADNYNIKLKSLKLFDERTYGNLIYLAEAADAKYIVKTYPLSENGIRTEGGMTEFARGNGISAPVFLTAKNGGYYMETDDMRFHVQEFIKGETLKLNTAPEWYMEESAYILGRIHKSLKNFDELPVNSGDDFYHNAAGRAKKRYTEMLNVAVRKNDKRLRSDLEDRVRHLERTASFDIDTGRLTYGNSHGDFHIGNTLVNDKNITVIDWTHASKLPLCFEVIRSYIYASPACADGGIDGDGLKRYINNYFKYGSLNSYDLQIMPYLYYYQQMLWHYSPSEYDNLPDYWKEKCSLIINVTNWLYNNADTLAKDLLSV